MFEFDQYNGTLHKEPPAKPAAPYEPVDGIAGMAFLYWGEHCVECSAPACYSSCDLYEPRFDLRCRRFGFGAYKNNSFRSFRGHGVEVSFKKWAKLEALGSTAIYPVSRVLMLERLIETGAPVTNALGALVNKGMGNIKWAKLTYVTVNEISHNILKRVRKRASADAFLLELYNPGPKEIRLQVIFSVDLDRAEPNGEEPSRIAPVINTVCVPYAYSRHQFDAALLQPLVENNLPFRITILPEATDNARLVVLSADLVKFKKQAFAANDGKNVKCVIWDLDNTLWNGTLAEGDAVTLRPGVSDLLALLDERGILLSVVSKNDFGAAWEKIKELGLAEYFLYPQIDWVPKSRQIETISRKLNLGLDSFAFIDDSPFELAEVSRAIPQVLCIPVRDMAMVSSDARFSGNITEESRQRRHYYQAQVSRERDQETSGQDYMRFLASCETVLDIAPYSDNDRERVAELVQRTNQLNFSGRKYSRTEFDEIIPENSIAKYVLTCTDKYGSYGTVGLCLARQENQCLEIMDLMLSCRVQGKSIEQALFSHLVHHHNPDGATWVWLNFHQTQRNGPARKVLDALGFRPCESEAHGRQDGMILQMSDEMRCEVVEVRCSASHEHTFPEAGGANGSFPHMTGK